MTPGVGERITEILAGSGPVDPTVLDELWAAAEAVPAAEVLGDWRGEALPSGHPVEGVLQRSRWHGKRFVAVDDAHPLICRAEDGSLYSDTTTAGGTASLWDVAFRGEVTATMVYDGRPVLDHLKRVDADTLLGVMNGKGVLHEGHHFYFVLRRS